MPVPDDFRPVDPGRQASPADRGHRCGQGGCRPASTKPCRTPCGIDRTPRGTSGSQALPAPASGIPKSVEHREALALRRRPAVGAHRATRSACRWRSLPRLRLVALRPAQRDRRRPRPSAAPLRRGPRLLEPLPIGHRGSHRSRRRSMAEARPWSEVVEQLEHFGVLQRGSPTGCRELGLHALAERFHLSV